MLVIKQGVLAAAPGAAPGFSVYPNPAVGQATALFDSQGEAVQLSLFDGLGRALSPGTQRVPLDVRASPRCLPLRGA